MTSSTLLTDIAARQGGVLARWQLVAAGWSPGRASNAGRGLRSLHDGVWVTGAGPVTAAQRWWAATLTAPATALSDTAAGVAWEIRASSSSPLVTVTRRGACGPVQVGDLRVRYSATLTGNVTWRDGMLITTPERTIIDLWPTLTHRQASRVLRDAIRLGLTTVPKLVSALEVNRGRRGVARVRATLDPYVRLPLDRCRSDAEVEGLLILDGAGREIPEVNRRWAGEEADFCWPGRLHIVEIDGPQYHLDPLENARKTRIWTRAGFRVDRIGTEDVYRRPERLLALVD